MSSDNFSLEITAIDSTAIELTGTCWQDPNGFATTRSFVLMALEQVAEPLSRALASLDFIARCTEPGFYEEHVGRFVASTRLVRRARVVEDEALWREARNAVYRTLIASGLGGETLQTEIDVRFPPPTFVVAATMTSPKWLAGLRLGTRFGTTAYDVWDESTTTLTQPASSHFLALVTDLHEAGALVLVPGAQPTDLPAPDETGSFQAWLDWLIALPQVDDLLIDDEGFARAFFRTRPTQPPSAPLDPR